MTWSTADETLGVEHSSTSMHACAIRERLHGLREYAAPLMLGWREPEMGNRAASPTTQDRIRRLENLGGLRDGMVECVDYEPGHDAAAISIAAQFLGIRRDRRRERDGSMLGLTDDGAECGTEPAVASGVGAEAETRAEVSSRCLYADRVSGDTETRECRSRCADPP
jgi:hypothetical protein